MSEDKTPRRPDGLDDSDSSYSDSSYSSSYSSQSGQSSNPYSSQDSSSSSYSSSNSYSYSNYQSEPSPERNVNDTQRVSQPSGSSSGGSDRGSSSTEMVSRTVVKTKTKKLPVFLSACAGLLVGAILVVALAMSGVLDLGSSSSDTESSTSSSSSSSSTTTIEIDPEDTTLAEVVAAKALPSVVSITVTCSDSTEGIGSGVILDTDGNILTNYHVIEDAEEIVVTLDSGDTYEAEVLGSDDSSDLAVVTLVDAGDAELTPIEIGDSDDINVGEWVMAIGSPFGNEQSVTTGIVSALYRSTALTSTSGTSIYVNMIQTDAAINPGNSGGALVNAEGQLIGINSLIESYSESSAGVGFAIPVNYAMKIADQILAGETPVHPYVGVTLTSVDALSALQNGSTVTEGAEVVAVTDGSPADEAGIEVGDIITMVDDTEITSADSLIIAVRTYDVGDTVTFTLVRDSTEMTVEVTLGSDEALQTEEEDDSSDTSSQFDDMTEEELREYLEDLLDELENEDSSGNSDSGNSDSGNGDSGNSDSGNSGSGSGNGYGDGYGNGY